MHDSTGTLDLPIRELLPQIAAALTLGNRLIIEAAPGAGKTTVVPLALLDAPWRNGRIVMLEPRRVAARAAAARMAQTLGEKVGAQVGYRVRNDVQVGPHTQIEVLTEAILTRIVQDDPALDGIAVLIFDEFHERNLHADLGLALALDVQANLRPDLRLVVMSATLDGERLATHLDCARLTSAGRAYPVEIEYQAPRANEDLRNQARRALTRALDAASGDVLIFLPGKAEIAALQRALTSTNDARISEVLVLHGELELAEQAKVLAEPPLGARRVILATNLAESSLTLPGVGAVIDAGLAREPRFDPISGFSRLETVRVSQASATQRAGRAGRLGPGLAIRLWPQSLRLAVGVLPEIAQVELSPLALELALWGDDDLRWVEPPPPGPLAQARDRLRDFAAIDAHGRITDHGRAMARLGLAPRLAHMLLRAPAALKALAVDLAVLLDARDPLRGEARFDDDLAPRVRALAGWRRDRRAPVDADRGALQALARDADALARRMGIRRVAVEPAPDPYAIGELLALAFPDRIARADPADPLRYQLANGRGARLDPRGSSLRGQPWLAISELRPHTGDAQIQRAAALDEAHLRARCAERFESLRTLRFDLEQRAVECEVLERFGELVLSRTRLPAPRDAASATVFLDGISRLGLDALPWTEPLRQWRARVTCLAQWLPEAGMPDLSDRALLTTLDQWLAPFVAGLTRLDAISPALLGEALAAMLDHRQRQLLDLQAPASWVVPSGNARRLDYAPDRPPVLAVKLQELFGLADTPRIAQGRVPVTLHLLSPAGRPLQVTQDLKGFWERTYAEVRKELKGRYPKHPWPDDPWSATPTARAKPRGT